MLKGTVELAAVRDSSRRRDNQTLPVPLKAVRSDLPGVMAGDSGGLDSINV